MPTSQKTMPEYRICIQERMGPSGAAWFEGFTFIMSSSQTCLQGPVMDQAALHGLLNRIRDLGLTLVTVQRMDEGTKNENLCLSSK